MAITTGGICFTFYDAARWSLFNTYYPIIQRAYPGWKATYFMDEWDTLSAGTKTQILTAQTAGIELGNHQLDSDTPASYLATHTNQEFYDNMVEAQQDLMIADGITPPVSFAYSGGEAPRTLSNLILSEASAIRIVMHKTAGIFSNANQSKGYYKSMFSQGNGAIGYEDINSDSERLTFDLDYIIAQLDYCKANRDVYIHSGHSLSATLLTPPALTQLYSTVQKISRYCACQGLEFYTMSDLVDAGFVGTERQFPSVSVINISGTQSSGNNLTATYTYQDSDDTAESGTTFQWYRADDATGTNSAAIGGATSLVYTLTGSDTSKYVRIGITPKAVGQTGYETFSKWLAIS